MEVDFAAGDVGPDTELEEGVVAGAGVMGDPAVLVRSGQAEVPFGDAAGGAELGPLMEPELAFVPDETRFDPGGNPGFLVVDLAVVTVQDLVFATG